LDAAIYLSLQSQLIPPAVNFHDLVTNLVKNTVVTSIPLFWPELVLCATIVLMLLVRVIKLDRALDTFYVALAGVLVSLYFAVSPLVAAEGSFADLQHDPTQIFTNLLVYDAFTVYFRCLLLVFTVLLVAFTRISGIPDREDSADFYSLLLGSVVGMMLMASANNMLIVFLGFEMASVPSYVLAGMLKGRRRSSEAALKFAVYGAGAAGVMLYGISLLSGVLGTVHLPSMGVRLAEMLQSGEFADRYVVLALGGLMLVVGLAFKLSAVPFHFWAPDVFEGASAEVGAFLSVASKAAALALLVRVALGFGYIQPEAWQQYEARSAKNNPVAKASGLMSVTDQSLAKAGGSKSSEVAAPVTRESLMAALAPARDFSVKLLAFLAMLTATLGNLAAYAQTNVKRLLAYSTIAHAGYMMMAVAAAMHLAGTDMKAAGEAIAALLFYLAIYLFMNLGAFTVVAVLRNAGAGEEIEGYSGLIQQRPLVVLSFAVILCSLIGIPPLAGFWPKVRVFWSLIESDSPWLWALLVVGGLNTAISVYYYLRLVKVMTIDDPSPDRPPLRDENVFASATYVAIVTLPLIVLGVWWNGLHQWCLEAAGRLMG